MASSQASGPGRCTDHHRHPASAARLGAVERVGVWDVWHIVINNAAAVGVIQDGRLHGGGVFLLPEIKAGLAITTVRVVIFSPGPDQLQASTIPASWRFVWCNFKPRRQLAFRVALGSGASHRSQGGRRQGLQIGSELSQRMCRGPGQWRLRCGRWWCWPLRRGKKPSW